MSLERLGPYRIQRKIGEGGMGAVYEATHDGTGQLAAVKVLTALQGSNQSLRVRFDAEVETLKTLKHPNIVQLYGYGEQDGHLFYAMELVAGKSLHDELRDGRPFLPADVARLGAEMCAALKHAHDHGVIHRDLKPANLLLTTDGHIKLADFGIAKLFGASQLTLAGGIVGTADYMSPEQADGLPITIRSDFYSLGCVLYALLARRPPFTGRSIAQVIHALKFDVPLQLRRLAPDAPLELEELIHQLLEKDPQKRAATALVIGNRLKAIEHGLRHQEKKKNEAPNAASDGDEDYRLADVPNDSGTRTIQSDKPTRAGTQAAVTPPASPAPGDGTAATKIHTPAPSGAVPTSGKRQPTIGATGFPSAVSRFTTVTEDELRRSRAEEESRSFDNALIGKIAAAIVFCVIGGWVIWSLLQPPTASALYQQFASAGLSSDFEELEKHEAALDQFLSLYPTDFRQPHVLTWKSEIVRQRKTRQIGRETRRLNNFETLNAAQRAFHEANELAAANPEAASEKLEALLSVFGDPSSDVDEATAQTMELARGQLERLKKGSDKQLAANRELVRRQLDRAEKLATSDSAAATAIRRGIVQLFADKPWAKELVDAAQAALVVTPESPPN